MNGIRSCENIDYMWFYLKGAEKIYTNANDQLDATITIY